MIKDDDEKHKFEGMCEHGNFKDCESCKEKEIQDNGLTAQDLAVYYCSTHNGKFTFTDDEYGHSLEEIIELMANPTDPNLIERFEIDEREKNEIIKFIENTRKLVVKRKKLYKDMRERHQKNSLFRDSFSDVVPDNFVSVYRFQSEETLDHIAENGIKIEYTDLSVLGSEENFAPRGRIGAVLESFAPNGLKKINAIHALPEYRITEDVLSEIGVFLKMNPVLLELKVDPDKVFVVDVSDYNSLAGEFFGSDSLPSEEAAKKYWGKAITLREYNVLSPQERAKKFEYPEILISDDIEKNHIRVLPA